MGDVLHILSLDNWVIPRQSRIDAPRAKHRIIGNGNKKQKINGLATHFKGVVLIL